MLDDLEEIINAGWPVPGTRRAMVEVDKATELVETIREHFPAEMETARAIAADREGYLQQANAEAQRVVEEAHRQAAELVQQEGIYKTAERQARALLDQANARAEEIRAKADDYAVESLRSLEARLTQTLATVQNGIASLNAQAQRQGED